MAPKPKTPIALDEIVARNVALVRNLERASHHARSVSQRLSERIVRYCGSTLFICWHFVWCAGWIAWNLSPYIGSNLKFDNPPFPVLTMCMSLGAIFLSTFILISQNRQHQISAERANIDLQINMLAEQESSHMLEILMQIKTHMGIEDRPQIQHDEASALREATDVQNLITQLQESIVHPGAKLD